MAWTMGQTPLDPSGTWRWRRRQLRNVAVVLMALVALGHAVGVPHLRWEYTYRGPRSSPVISSGTYIGPTGVHTICACDRECSLVVFIKPQRPLWGLLGELTETPS
ncbi:hypothetical protein Pla108_14380 [Botrimarina colliarenosi]|uniref:Uncharacterized protein n=1 Tax=Botrimarina colliarenosi TaxID=2528001 RepID=A0A5C6ALZ1_9BACT|nr:hypothetical protein [Botrimarina colliarenosi]TWU00487.1 hypothetical protein Pla108_14380 [Botrimarina colliarenosi]